MNRARLVLADDHNLLLDAFRLLLQPQFDVVGAFADGRALIEAAPALSPDAAVLDIGMPVMNGLNAGQRLRQILPKVKLIYLTMNQDPDLAAEAFRAGASGYVLKSSSTSELVHAISEALQGRSYVTPLLAKGTGDSVTHKVKRGKSRRKLTLRQHEVLQLLAEGRSMKEVAYILDVTRRTVAFHKYSIMRKLQLKTTADLIKFAVKSSSLPA